MKTNTSDNYIAGIYKNKYRQESAMVYNFEVVTGLKVTRAYGGFYLNIHDVFQEENNGLENKSLNYGSLCFLGNICGKTERQLYFKNKLLMDSINAFRLSMDRLGDEVRDSIDQVIRDHGHPKMQVAILAYIARN